MNIVLPTYYDQLTGRQLEYLYRMICSRKFTAEEIQVYCFYRFSNIQELHPSNKKARFVTLKDNSQYKLHSFFAYKRQIAEHLPLLDWLREPPSIPVRLETVTIGGKEYKARDKDFNNVKFADYLVVENLYTGFLFTQNETLMNNIARVLYDIPGEDNLPIEDSEDADLLRYNCFMWFHGFKQQCVKLYPNLFTESTGGADYATDLFKKLKDNTDAQIIALTGGDITKEETVTNIDTPRALTYLNDLAKRAGK